MAANFDDVGPENPNFQAQAAQCHEALAAAVEEAMKHYEPRVVIGAGFATLVQAYKDHMPEDFSANDARHGLEKMVAGYFAQIFLGLTPGQRPCPVCGHFGHFGHHDPRCANRVKG